MQHTFSEIGYALAMNGWGWESQLPLHDFIRSLDKESEVLCLLCHLAKELREIRHLGIEIKNIDRSRKHDSTTSDPAADALLRFYQGGHGDGSDIGTIGVLESGRADHLTVRSRKVLRRVAADAHHPCTTLADLTEDRLLEERNCGLMTATEIMKWKQAIITAGFTTETPRHAAESPENHP